MACAERHRKGLDACIPDFIHLDVQHPQPPKEGHPQGRQAMSPLESQLIPVEGELLQKRRSTQRPSDKNSAAPQKIHAHIQHPQVRHPPHRVRHP
eukprot:CAMPEP_0172077748 /NCGR_PEP_ID=MMETSP1043-20130122/17236_1 /TAXON_ID=464988 /ORGANISM="Hemiselmis andersenii, Strain CCMP441" /LENGTH=94 /DNA_ID=CAMNT_0012738747 /DNA_START=96 /DNA_END=378 /DNA_ORIENTATION=-